jgi:chromate transporter
LSRDGYPGAIAAWLGFTLPSAVIPVLLAFGLTKFSSNLNAGWLHGLKIIAVLGQ